MLHLCSGDERAAAPWDGKGQSRLAVGAAVRPELSSMPSVFGVAYVAERAHKCPACRVKSDRQLTTGGRGQSSVGLRTRGEKRERHIIRRLAASLPDLCPCPHDAALVGLRRIAAIRQLSITQGSLCSLNQIVAVHNHNAKSSTIVPAQSDRPEADLR